jgi:tetratricopeptide (TPR) repeat protein
MGIFLPTFACYAACFLFHDWNDHQVEPMKSFVICVLLLLLAGCASFSLPPKPPVGGADDGAETVPVKPETDPLPPRFYPGQILAMIELLEEADEAITQQRLTTPVDDNALFYYHMVLKIDPDNEEAKAGLEMIIGRYIQWADVALQQGRPDQAFKYLKRASTVDPKHPSLLAGFRRIEAAGREASSYFRLDSAALKGKTAKIRQQLGGIADEIRRWGARVVIEAGTDEQGRWIFGQLNSRHEDFLIRGNIRLAPQPGVRLIY